MLKSNNSSNNSKEQSFSNNDFNDFSVIEKDRENSVISLKTKVSPSKYTDQHN